MRLHGIAAGLLLGIAALFATLPTQAQEVLSHGRFRNVTVYTPKTEVRQVVLFLSGRDGWDEDMADMARTLMTQGTLVAGINTPQLFSAFEADDGDCATPSGDLDNLSRFIQAYYKLPTYRPPVLAGHAAAAGFAYAMLAQAPAGTFAGALSLNFNPALALNKPLCKGAGLLSTPRRHHGGATLQPTQHLPAPWVVLQPAQIRGDAPAQARTFISQVEGAELIELPEGGPRDWRLQLITAFGKLAAQEKTQALPQPSLPDLPIVEVQAHGNTSKLFAVMLSGDGGWAGLDREVAAALTARGVSVVGIDSLRYFWQARTPQGLADDLDRVLRYYAGRWQKSRALLIGYLQGADVLPFALNRLPAASRALVAQTALLGIGNQAAFEFHLSNWVGKSGDHPILPEVRRWPANTALCIYGAEEKDSPCPVAFASHTLPIRLTGGHHFNGDYDVLARTILEHVPE